MPREATKPTTRPTAPDDLSDEARLEWDRVMIELDAIGLLDSADRALLTVYCRTWQAWHTCARHVAQFGPVVKLPNGWPGESKQNEVATKLAKNLTSILSYLGLSPAARAKLMDASTVPLPPLNLD